MVSRLFVVTFALSACAPGVVDSPTVDKARALSMEVDGNRVFSDIEALAALHSKDTRVDCAGLNTKADTWCNLTNTASRTFVADRLRSLGMTPELDTIDTHPATSNVFAELRGTTKPDEVILVGAHFDAFFMGADDNSSGVAVMLEVARLLANRPLARTVRFVGFDHEEIGLVGSTRHVKSKARPKASLVFDCVGYADDAPGSQGSLPGFPTPSAGNFLAAIANDVSRPQVEQLLQAEGGKSGIPVLAIIAPGLGAGPLSGNLMRSDHAPFWLAGESAVFFTDTANFRNKNYHTRQDTPDTLNRPFLTGAAKASVMSVVAFGDAP